MTWISTRYLVGILSSIGLGIIYGCRVNFNVAIVTMVNYTAIGQTDPDIKEDGPFEWHQSVQGLLKSSFYWGYICSLIPGGRMAEVFSAKWVMFFAVFINVLMALLTPLMANLHYSALLIVRILQGIGGGTTFPTMHVILAHWAPPDERSTICSIVYAGTSIGTVIYILLSGVIASKLGWVWIFYIEGLMSASWLIFWVLLVSDGPANHKFISEEEKEYIMQALHQVSADGSKPEKLKMPWKAAIFNRAFFAIIVANTCSNWGFYLILTELPQYMKTILKFKIEENGYLASLPFLTMFFFMILFGKCMDILKNKNILTITSVRKIATAVASLIPMICLVCLCYLDGKALGVTFMTIAVGATGAMYSGFMTNHIDIAPNFAGTLMALTNTIGTTPGIAVPIVVNAMLDKDNSITSWRIIFWFTAASFLLEFIVYTIFGTGELQEWNKGKQEATT